MIVVPQCRCREGAEARELVSQKFLFANMDVKEDGFIMPKDPKTGLSVYMFVEFNTPEQAEVAIKTADGFAMDKKHIISVNAFDDIGKYANAPEEFKEPERESFVEKDHLRGWLLDERCRDQ
ncbi:hypothetical protein BJ742DRAFT_137242 [Cladochytrium replicatum]|nr:hypothetical protein BJ742DRAFT_137242 [Cladochytrium replicatum]